MKTRLRPLVLSAELALGGEADEPIATGCAPSSERALSTHSTSEVATLTAVRAPLVAKRVVIGTRCMTDAADFCAASSVATSQIVCLGARREGAATDPAVDGSGDDSGSSGDAIEPVHGRRLSRRVVQGIRSYVEPTYR